MAHCTVCGRQGPSHRTRNFLCEDCVHPLEIRSFCTQCRNHTTYPLEAGFALLRALFPEQPPATGVVIHFPHCFECAPNGPDAFVRVYRIRDIAPP